MGAWHGVVVYFRRVKGIRMRNERVEEDLWAFFGGVLHSLNDEDAPKSFRERSASRDGFSFLVY
jgi:hypothetical protein